MKKIASINKIAYLMASDIMPTGMGQFQDTGLVYYLFPESKEVERIIKEYEANEFFHKFGKFRSTLKVQFAKSRDNKNA